MRVGWDVMGWRECLSRWKRADQCIRKGVFVSWCGTARAQIASAHRRGCVCVCVVGTRVPVTHVGNQRQAAASRRSAANRSERTAACRRQSFCHVLVLVTTPLPNVGNSRLWADFVTDQVGVYASSGPVIPKLLKAPYLL
jgi:hypothetical protein